MAVSLVSTGITFPDGTTQTTAASGGVTSLNGQTGAITNTSVDAIGSYIVAVRAVTSPGNSNSRNRPTIGSTIAGSSLRHSFSQNSLSWSDFEAYGYSSATAYASGGTALTGTWRCVGRAAEGRTTVDSATQYRWYAGLWVRVS